MEKRHFLLEIGCEELPPTSLLDLSNALADGLRAQLEKADLAFEAIQPFATPRRLAVLVRHLATKQPTQTIERRGPSYDAAYDQDGAPTLACIGFAHSCHTSVDQLIKKETPKGTWLCYSAEESGETTENLLPDLVKAAIKTLPIKKPMRWGNHSTLFIRPVHWVIMLFGKDVIHTEILGQQTGQQSLGHRFHHPRPLTIHQAEDYQQLLQTNGMVIVDFEKRRKLIRKSIEEAAGKAGRAVIDDDLLNEVTAMVEWPVALCGQFKKTFLDVPAEVLITAMKTHQRCFPVVDEHNALSPHFILVSNIDSKHPETVVTGNERVINARLADAAFFYQNDLKHSSKERAKQLSSVIFQKQLGSLADKTQRISKLAAYIAKEINEDPKNAKHAAELAKTDLVSEMVVEFPSLQGTMGYYYARHDGESEAVALAIKEHYQPHFSGAPLPDSLLGCCVALADKLDTLVGIFGINKRPTGDKDPFGLRRLTLGIIRILIEKKLALDLVTLLTQAYLNYETLVSNEKTVEQAFSFFNDRLRAWYIDQDVPTELFSSVLACNPGTLLDFDQRIHAVQHFQTLPEARALSAANKRVSNILKKQKQETIPQKINPALFESEAECKLGELLELQTESAESLYKTADYSQLLSELSTLKEPVDAFFNEVMIMTDDKKKRLNRLALLTSLHQLFTQVADIALLP